MQSSDFAKIELKMKFQNECSVNLMQNFKTPFQRKTFEGLLLKEILFPP